MMTPQEVANCTFAKATLGGYNMASVDDFLVFFFHFMSLQIHFID